MKTNDKSTIVRGVFILHPSSFILVAAALFGGCGTVGPTHETPRAPEAKAPPTPPAAPVVRRGGGYYLDDGPGDNPPPNLEAVPDAVPRAEPLHRGAVRPYTVMGRNYVPMTAVAPYRARGVASWYGRRYHGKLTSTGEPYDMYAMTAAHPTLPLPSYVRVTSVANGKSVILRVNDRGPFIDSRLIDLSYTAAYKLGVIAGGSALVDVELIQPGAPVMAAAPLAPPTPPAPPVPPVPMASSTESPALPSERAMPLAAEGNGIYLQLAAFTSKDNAEAYAARLRADVAWLAGQLQVLPREGMFRVRAGPYGSAGDARQSAERINLSLGIKPMVQQK